MLDDAEHRAFREEAWRLYEAWLNGEPTVVDLTEEGSDGDVRPCVGNVRR